MSSAMDEDVLSVSCPSSLPTSAATAPAESQPQRDISIRSDSSLSRSQTENKDLWTENTGPAGDKLLSGEEQVTLITDSLTVTSTDQEKLMLLNANTELRRVNKELMKLNEDWDQVYRSATLGLQRKLEAVELESSAVKQLNSRLLLKVEQQQSAREYYEQALMVELKRNQELQDYIRLLETRIHHPEREPTPPPKWGSFSSGIGCPGSAPSSSQASASPLLQPPFLSPEAEWNGKNVPPLGTLGNNQQEVKDLKEQLKTLKCQTEIYEADYQTEHNDHKHTLQENRRLRKKREEMRQQVALLQEQLKIYEDDFRRERSDKQMLQRLLQQKSPANKEAQVLVHRCNNERQGGERKQQHHPLCPKHRDKESG